MFFLLACFSAQSPSISSKQPPPEKEPTQTTPKSVQKQAETQEVQIFLWDVAQQNLSPTTRSVSSINKEQHAIDVLYKGPNSSESSLSLLSCASTGAKILSLEAGLAKVQLQGDCSGCGSMSIYDSLVATLKHLPSVNTVHILDPQGKTQSNGDHLDARPACLNP